MQLTAFYENGQLIFDPMIQLRRAQLPVVVIIPDHEIIWAPPSPTWSAKSSPTIEEWDADLIRAQQLLGPEYRYVATHKTDQELLAEALTEKYL